MNAKKFFRIKQIGSSAGRLPVHRRTIEALGFRHVGDVVEIADTPQIRGMLTQVHYLLEITPVAGTLQKKANPMREKRRALKAKAKKG
ncbi:MAG: 50S ribosomal protein L30 [Deltaproteobacteria bacterium]|nr:50S ribosomal protein L30 [Deltaproteobacteria bacterium]